VTRSGLGVEFG